MNTRTIDFIFIHTFENNHHLFKCCEKCNRKFILKGELKIVSKYIIDASNLKFFCDYEDFIEISN